MQMQIKILLSKFDWISIVYLVYWQTYAKPC